MHSRIQDGGMSKFNREFKIIMAMHEKLKFMYKLGRVVPHNVEHDDLGTMTI